MKDVYSLLCRFKGPRIRTVDKYLCLLLVIMVLLAMDSMMQAMEHVKVVQDPEITAQLATAMHELDKMKQQNEQLTEIFQNISFRNTVTEEERNATFMQLWQGLQAAQKLINIQTPQIETPHERNHTTHDEPSLKYELTRRRVEEGVNEMWFFFSAQLKLLAINLTDTQPEIVSQLHRMEQEGVEHKRSLLHAAQRLAVDDGYATWRDREARELSELVQRRLHRLQNPQDCRAARKLICHVNRFCGYACQVTHILYCLMQAYGMQRTMILESDEWTSYDPSHWSDVFLPVTNCTEKGSDIKPWPGTADSLAIFMVFVDHKMNPKPEFLPLGIPRDLAPRITRLHGEPAAWWVGQFWLYLLRSKPNLRNITQQAALRLNFSSPVVGVQIRRSDKLQSEAKFHALEEYMSVVKEYYTQLELSQHVEKRRVYIATDDPSVFEEAKTKYPTYEVLGDPKIATTASAILKRSSDLHGIITDVHLLAHSDYLVCTFSSGVCRLAYEIMQSLHTDASFRFRSLDDVYYSSGQTYGPTNEVVYNHNKTREGEIDLKIGDIIYTAGNHWDGYSMGKNNRTGQNGLYPSHKVVRKFDILEFPAFVDVDEG